MKQYIVLPVSRAVKKTAIKQSFSLPSSLSPDLTSPLTSIMLATVRAGPARQSLSNPARVERQQRYGSVSGCRRSPARAFFTMTSNRWLFILLALAAGIGIGLAYGWVIDPVDFFDLTPDTLRADYKADYVLMTAEAYHVEQDAGMAARRLAIFGGQSPSAIAAEGLAYARANSFANADVALMQELVTTLQAWSGLQ